jgi:DNA-damage-inducible protein D
MKPVNSQIKFWQTRLVREFGLAEVGRMIGRGTRNHEACLHAELSGLIFERGVDNQGFARIRSKGDKALFGGFTTNEMKQRLQVPGSRPLADFLPTITIKAKDFATEITNFNVKKDDLKGEPAITSEHVKNNQSVRQVLKDRGIKPEELPPEEDIKKVQRKVAAEDKKLLKSAKKLRAKKIGK